MEQRMKSWKDRLEVIEKDERLQVIENKINKLEEEKGTGAGTSSLGEGGGRERNRELKKMESFMERSEKEYRRKNGIIKGLERVEVKEEEKDIGKRVENFLRKRLKSQVRVVSARLIGERGWIKGQIGEQRAEGKRYGK